MFPRFTTALLCITFAKLSADVDTDATFRNWENRLHILECNNDPCRIFPSARPVQNCGWGAYVIIDPLWLRAQENGLEFVAVTQNHDQIPPIPPVGPIPVLLNYIFGNSRLKGPHFQNDWGFRVGLGVNLPHDEWDLSLFWTRFRTDAHKHVKADATTFLTPTSLNGQTAAFSPTASPVLLTPANQSQGLLNEAFSFWRLHLNALDLELGRAFYLSKWLKIKPFAGLRSAWIDQRNKLKYLNLLPVSDPTITNAFHTKKCNYWGIGLIGGINTEWGVGCGWSIFANGSASLLYGYFNVSAREEYNGFYSLGPGSTIPFDIKFFNAHDFYHLNRFITDLSTGLRYDIDFCNYHLGFQIGWETHQFFGQNQFIQFVGMPKSGLFSSATSLPAEFVANQGDLSLQGLSAQIEFDF